MTFILLLFTHMKMKKMLLGAFLWMFTLAGVAVLPNYASAQQIDQGGDTSDFSNNYGWFYAQDTQYNAGVAWSKKLQNDSLIKTVRNAINRVLGMLSLIALALCLRWGFKMMTSGGDEKKYWEGLNILKWAAIGLAVIAVSWLIVSFIFFVINKSIWSTWASSVNNTQSVDTNNGVASAQYQKL